MDERSAALVDVVDLSGDGGRSWTQDGHHPRELAVLGLVVLEVGDAHVESIRIPHSAHGFVLWRRRRRLRDGLLVRDGLRRRRRRRSDGLSQRIAAADFDGSGAVAAHQFRLCCQLNGLCRNRRNFFFFFSFSFEFWPELWTFVRGLTVCAGFGFEADVDDSGAVGDDFTLVALVVRDADALARMRRRDRRRSFRSFAEDLSHHFRIDGRFCRKSQIFIFLVKN